MKASIYTQYGSPEVLHIKELEKPAPQANELLVRVYAATVNRSDCAMLTAKPFIMRFGCGLFKPKKQILGTDFAGEVEATGQDVSLFKVGDRVFGFDDAGVQSHAEYLTISEKQAMARIPENIDFKKATASIEGAHYAYNFINKVNLQKRQKILVNGASGAIGSAAVQLLRYFGADVVAVCNTKNIELIKSLGAERIIDYQNEDFTKDPEKFDCVFDMVGKSTFGKCKRLLKPGGIYISSDLGPSTQNLIYSLVSWIMGSLPGQGGKKVKFPYPSDRKGSCLLMQKLLREGHFKPVIDRTYPLEKIADAFRYVLTGQKTGNVVIDMIG